MCEDECTEISISMRGWSEISDFLTGNFLQRAPNTRDMSTQDLASNDSVLTSNEESPQMFLQSLRLKNIDRILIGHLNINSIPNKIEHLNYIVRDRADIFLVSETKIDKVFQMPNLNFMALIHQSD